MHPPDIPQCPTQHRKVHISALFGALRDIPATGALRDPWLRVNLYRFTSGTWNRHGSNPAITGGSVGCQWMTTYGATSEGSQWGASRTTSRLPWTQQTNHWAMTSDYVKVLLICFSVVVPDVPAPNSVKAISSHHAQLMRHISATLSAINGDAAVWQHPPPPVTPEPSHIHRALSIYRGIFRQILK